MQLISRQVDEANHMNIHEEGENLPADYANQNTNLTRYVCFLFASIRMIRGAAKSLTVQWGCG